jgi:hypothetical protein
MQETKGPETSSPAARPPRAERRAARVAQREQTRRQQKVANWRRRWLPWLVLAGLVVLGLAAFIYFVVIPRGQPLEGLEKYGGLSQDHVPGVPTYPQTPPVGGPHANNWQNCGIYDQPVPSQFGVHSLEHGAVWITYQPDLPASDVQKLRDVARGNDYVLLSPWGTDPPLPSPVVASAWGLQVKLDGASDPRLAEFVRRYANGTQAPERGAICRGGVGNPIQG